MNKIDYQEFTTKDMSLKERREIGVGDIWSNSIQCLECKDIIRSKHRYDFVRCECGECFVDGGSWCGRYGAYKDINNVKVLTEYYNEV
jgi:hypothetical protein